MAEDDIRYLIQIVKKDLEIQERKKFLGNSPPMIVEIERQISEMDEELRESEEAIKRLGEERRHLEREVDAQRAKIIQKKIEQNAVKTTRELRALDTEIEYISRQVDVEEERIIAIFDKNDIKTRENDAITKKINDSKGKLLSDKNSLENTVKRYKEELEVLEDEKVRILPHISDRVRNLYIRILGVKGDSGVANLIGDICQGCYSRVPPQKGHEIRKNNRIQTCEVCGRILVYYPTDNLSLDKE